jgi:phage repressor protein C with HTH and peptisase S24 domain
MKYNVGTWVKDARLNAGLSQEKLAFALEVSGKATVSAWEKNKNSPPFEVMVRISDICSYPLPYIEPTTSTPTLEKEPRKGFIQFKLLDAKAVAGVGAVNSDFPEPIQLIEVSEAWAERNIGGNFSSISIVTAQGDSMVPTFENGDLLFIDGAVDFYSSEGIYVFSSTIGLKVKRLQRSVNGSLRVISDNKNYPVDVLSNDEIDSIKICGKVIAVLRLDRI